MKFGVKKIFLVSFMQITFSDCPSNIYTHVQLFATPWTIACQAPLFMGFSGQEYWSGLPFPPSGDLTNPGLKPRSPALEENSLPTEPSDKPLGKTIDKNNPEYQGKK